MKRLAPMLAILFGCAGPAMAFGDQECSELATLAENIMRAHQSGASLESALRVLNENVKDPEAAQAFKQMIILAYREPRYETDSNKQRAINNFRDKNHVECLAAAN